VKTILQHYLITTSQRGLLPGSRDRYLQFGPISVKHRSKLTKDEDKG